MIELSAVFIIFLVCFGIIGLLRGWVREVQVTAATVLAMYIIEKIGPWVGQVLVDRTPLEMLAIDPLGTLRRLVMLKTVILLAVVFFGYQGPMVIHFATQGRVKANRARETIQEGFLGLLFGLINGYLIVGALWWYMDSGHYPFDWIISPSAFPNSISTNMIAYLPLHFLASPWLEILVIVFFLMVLVIVI